MLRTTRGLRFTLVSGLAALLIGGALLASPVASASAPQSRLPHACAHIDLSYQKALVRDICRALATGNVAKLIRLCRSCGGTDLAVMVSKWRNPAYRQAMIHALEAGGFGADLVVYPAFASEAYITDNGRPGLTDYDAELVRRATTYLGITFPQPIPDTWSPDYHGPVIGISYYIDPKTGKDGRIFDGSFDYGQTDAAGRRCVYPGGGCA